MIEFRASGILVPHITDGTPIRGYGLIGILLWDTSQQGFGNLGAEQEELYSVLINRAAP